MDLATNVTASDVVNTLFKEVWKLDRLPSKIVTDMDAKFSHEFWQSLRKALRIKQRMSMAYHPQTDGQTETTNQLLEGYLQNLCQL